MKASILLTGLTLLATTPGSRAQTVLVGDSTYLTLWPRRDSLASVVARLGRHYRKQELLTWFHVRWRGGASSSSTNVIGYALRYNKLGATFCVENEKEQLNEIHFDSTAAVVSARGIRPGASSFAEVIEKYGLPLGSDQNGGLPKISGHWEIDKRGFRRHYLALNYPSIRFISWGEWGDDKIRLARPVQEIWLR